MITPDEAVDLLRDSVLTITEELEKNPTPARRQELETSRTTLMTQIDTVVADQLDSGARAVRAAADALQAVVLTGSTDPLAIIVRQLREAAIKNA
jgi:hypothetical protein